MSNYSITGSPIGALDISTIELGGPYHNRKFPNKKISLGIHEAHGGYIVEIDNSMKDNDLYIIGIDQDLGQEIGKIITHHIMQKNESTNR
jgi:hypothetical protein